MRDIYEIILHCTATVEGKDYDIKDVRRWHRKRGWRDVGYHYLIGLGGQIEKGRPLDQVGAHVYGHNQHSIGIAYVGGLDHNRKPKDTRTIDQKRAFIDLIGSLRKSFPKARLYGHSHFSNKACPCFVVKEGDFR